MTRSDSADQDPYPLTEAQGRIVALADGLAERFARRAATHDPQWSFPHENFAELDAAGYLRLVLPARYGGQDAGVLDMVLAQEHLARGDAGTALVTAMSINIIGRLRDDPVWPEPVLAKVCRTLAADGGGINSCVTEAELGSISRGGVPAATGTRVEGGWRINGTKIFVTGAPALRYFLTMVQLPASPDAPSGEVANAVVEAGATGLTMTDAWAGSLALRTCGNSDVTYEDVFVADEMMLERRPVGLGPAKPQAGKTAPGLNPWALSVAAVYLGIAEASIEAACDYANSRVPSGLGKPIAEQPHIQGWIGQMQVEVEAARAQLYETARLWDEAPPVRHALVARIAAAKYLCTRAACSVTETGLRVAGGFGLTGALPLERHFRDARAGLFQPPQDDLALGFVGRSALGERRR